MQTPANSAHQFSMEPFSCKGGMTASQLNCIVLVHRLCVCNSLHNCHALPKVIAHNKSPHLAMRGHYPNAVCIALSLVSRINMGKKEYQCLPRRRQVKGTNITPANRTRPESLIAAWKNNREMFLVPFTIRDEDESLQNLLPSSALSEFAHAGSGWDELREHIGIGRGEVARQTAVTWLNHSTTWNADCLLVQHFDNIPVIQSIQSNKNTVIPTSVCIGHSMHLVAFRL